VTTENGQSTVFL